MHFGDICNCPGGRESDRIGLSAPGPLAHQCGRGESPCSGPWACPCSGCWVCEPQGWGVWWGPGLQLQVLRPTCVVGAGSMSSSGEESGGAWVAWFGSLAHMCGECWVCEPWGLRFRRGLPTRTGPPLWKIRTAGPDPHRRCGNPLGQTEKGEQNKLDNYHSQMMTGVSGQM